MRCQTRSMQSSPAPLPTHATLPRRLVCEVLPQNNLHASRRVCWLSWLVCLYVCVCWYLCVCLYAFVCVYSCCCWCCWWLPLLLPMILAFKLTLFACRAYSINFRAHASQRSVRKREGVGRKREREREGGRETGVCLPVCTAPHIAGTKGNQIALKCTLNCSTTIASPFPLATPCHASLVSDGVSVYMCVPEYATFSYAHTLETVIH